MVFSEQPEPCPFFCTARCYLSFLSHTHGNGSLNIAKFHWILKPSIYFIISALYWGLRQKPEPQNFHMKFRYPRKCKFILDRKTRWPSVLICLKVVHRRITRLWDIFYAEITCFQNCSLVYLMQYIHLRNIIKLCPSVIALAL